MGKRHRHGKGPALAWAQQGATPEQAGANQEVTDSSPETLAVDVSCPDPYSIVLYIKGERWAPESLANSPMTSVLPHIIQKMYDALLQSSEGEKGVVWKPTTYGKAKQSLEFRRPPPPPEEFSEWCSVHFMRFESSKGTPEIMVHETGDAIELYDGAVCILRSVQVLPKFFDNGQYAPRHDDTALSLVDGKTMRPLAAQTIKVYWTRHVVP